MTARLYARTAGPLLVLLGIAGIFSGGFPLFGVLNVDPFENLLHLASGFVLLYAGFFPRGGRLAGVVSLVAGALYAFVGVAGIVVPNLFGLTPGGLGLADDLVHLSLGVFGIASADLDRRDAPPTGGAGRRTVGYAAGACLLGGPVLALLTGGGGGGVLVFCVGLILVGVRTLMGGGDRTVGWVMVFVGALAAVADLTRLLLGVGAG
ncbi:hypothetical protein [Rubrobacter tropicus]|uniref:hypothetical protein n=1 Tax=Rubrobacter tropicus TaxID=2653851 RepID=UPI00140DA360|nr:hypothetical protein [Rubrobacter tropicus]